MKEYKKIFIITTLITLLPIVAGLILWNRLPDQIATHWGMDGQANGWSSKTFAVLGMPVLLTVIHVITCAVTLNDPKRKNIHRKPLMLIFWIIPVLSLVINGITYLTALGNEMNVTVIVFVLIGILFIALGNYLPKLQQNYTVGIKLPWTLNSQENWTRTHRLGGKLFILSGFLLIICGFLGNVTDAGTFFGVSITVILILCAVIPAIYSFWLFRRGV